jgi:hypothetical protein
VYTIDAYRPIAGEITLASLGFKCKINHSEDICKILLTTPIAAFGFLLSFYTNPWISEVGYSNAYGTVSTLSLFALIGSSSDQINLSTLLDCI